MRVRTPLFRIAHLGIAVIVYSALGQVCSIVVRGLCQYSTFSSAKVQYRALKYSTGFLKNAFRVQEVMEFFVTKRVGTLLKSTTFSCSLLLFTFTTAWVYCEERRYDREVIYVFHI